MASNYPNPIPVYAVGDRSDDGSAGTITTNMTDKDGGDAVRIYRDEASVVLLRNVIIYSRGVNGGGKAYLWQSNTFLSMAKSFIGEAVIPPTTVRGLAVKIQLNDYDPALGEELRGIILERGCELHLQIEDGSISDGYRVWVQARDLTVKENFNTQD